MTAMSAILQNPLKPLSRPGLLRLLVRVTGFGSAGVPPRNPQSPPSESHSDRPVDDPAEERSLELAARRAPGRFVG
jgi:hypothetical protein